MKSLCISVSFFLFLSCAATVPPLSVLGKWHEVKKSDTVESIARKYGVDRMEIAELNQIPASGRVVGRSRIFIPQGTGMPPGDGKPPKGEPTAVAATSSHVSVPTAQTHTASTVSAPSGGKKNGSRCGVEGRPCFLWPTEGKLLQRFGMSGGEKSGSDGIDIQAARGTAVMAADNGEVLYSGNAIKGYGNLILIRHQGDVITVYAHNERNLVKEGTKVMRGEKIAEVGNSGVASKPLLHFEVRVNEQPVDPMLYLPAKE